LDSEQSTLDLRGYLAILKRRRWTVIATFVLVVVSAGLVSYRMTPIYRAEARVEVQPVSASATESSKVLESLVDPTRALQTQVELIKSTAVLDGAAKILELPSRKQLEKNLKVDLVQDTQIVKITVDHERPDEARDWANAVAKAYINFRRDRAIDQSTAVGETIGKQVDDIQGRIAVLEAQLKDPATASPTLKSQRDSLSSRLSSLQTQTQALPDVEEIRRGGGSTIAPAEAPTSPDHPKIKLNLALAVIVGAMLGLGLAFLAENLDDRVRSPEELEARVGVPALGYVPFVDEWEGAPAEYLATINEPASSAAEAYRTLRTNLRFMSMGTPLGALLVTSAIASEGKTTTAANLAVAYAQGGARTVLIAGDLRRPGAHKLFGLTNSRGLLNVLDPTYPIQDALQPTKVANLLFLAGGGIPPNPTEILASARFGKVLEALRGVADIVIIDAPPVLGLGDAGAVASKVDGVLLVVDAKSAARKPLAHAADQIRKAGGKIIGTVVNAVEAKEGYGYYYQYYYSQYENEDHEPPAGEELVEKGART